MVLANPAQPLTLAQRIRTAVIEYITDGTALPNEAFSDAASFQVRSAVEHCLETMRMTDEQLERSILAEDVADQHMWVPTMPGQIGASNHAPAVTLNICPQGGFNRSFRHTDAAYHGLYERG